ncbi:carbamoyltransferase HypF [Vibrio sp. WJH972]
MSNGIAIRVKGKVQGVGFRPYVWQLANAMNLHGDVINDGEGVLIRLSSLQSSTTSSSIKWREFERALISKLPPLARIESLTSSSFDWRTLPCRFVISTSQSTVMDTQIVPDAATCPACVEELLKHQDRRSHYPLINCTHCGPRFTIVKAFPYDRANTVMSTFPLCSDCSTEYTNPTDRRYHAQPIACHQCGPQVTVYNSKKELLDINWLDIAIEALTNGQIIALKSVGGFHLCCDATNAHAVQLLRQRKHRPAKPFAVMVPTLSATAEVANCTNDEGEMLASPVAPIVLVSKKTNTDLAQNIAPNLAEIGLMLPSNPIQHLLADHFNRPLVMTSANGSGLPPAIDNQDALRDLSPFVDYLVLHDRDIIQRCDDSVVRVKPDSTIEVLRRSRGLVPDVINFPHGFPDADGYLAYGGDLKSAFAVGKGRQIVVSQYLGDLANIETQQQYKKTIADYLSLYQLRIKAHVIDQHPGYFTHQLAQAKASDSNVIQVQHHHAHIASCLIENQWRPNQGKVLALALDGLGMGENGEWWGGELFIADYSSCKRLGGLPPIALVGGDNAAKQPWRSYFGHLKAFSSQISRKELAGIFPNKPLDLLERAMQNQINTHVVSSTGRLFDAVSASLGICFDEIEYEGQAASQLEALALQEQTLCDDEFAIPINDHHLDLSTFWTNWLLVEATTAQKAFLFHHALADAFATLVLEAQQEHKVNHVVLTGGVFHNALLTKLLTQRLKNHIQILQHQYYSCGDGGLALGQLAVSLCKPTL